jgi:hypothetical protein
LTSIKFAPAAISFYEPEPAIPAEEDDEGDDLAQPGLRHLAQDAGDP